MESELRYTLLGDGPSDRALMPILAWLLPQCATLGNRPLVAQFTTGQSQGLAARIDAALRLFPCELLFVHRDAERDALQIRVHEIKRALEGNTQSHVCIIPVRMTEAWLLINECAIRAAAGNPNGTVELDLPVLREIESLPDPKALLQQLLTAATGFTGRRRDRFRRDLSERVQRVAQLIEDFTPLRRLSAFQSFETETRDVVAQLVD